MGRLNAVPDELWDVARAALGSSIEEVVNGVHLDLDERDHHGHFILNTVHRALLDRFMETARPRAEG